MIHVPCRTIRLHNRRVSLLGPHPELEGYILKFKRLDDDRKVMVTQVRISEEAFNALLQLMFTELAATQNPWEAALDLGGQLICKLIQKTGKPLGPKDE